MFTLAMGPPNYVFTCAVGKGRSQELNGCFWRLAFWLLQTNKFASGPINVKKDMF